MPRNHHPTTTALLKAIRALRWKHTDSPLARAVRRWQAADCPDLELEGDSWQHVGDVALEVLDLLEQRQRTLPAPTKHAKLCGMILELCDDASDYMTEAEVADALLQAAAVYVTRRTCHQSVEHLQPRVAVNVLKAHFVRLGARALRGG